MKFGKVPVAQAKGAILAHSMALPDTKMRKGRVLSTTDLATLADAGVAEVVAAVLGPDDVHEDHAAAELASALGGADAGLEQSKAFTGRCNITAKTAGVVQINAAAIHAANAIHPMITVATVPPLQQMQAGGMIATIKIISYGVPDAALKAACKAAQGALTFAAPQIRTARLIITEVSGGAGEKGTPAIKSRLEALGVTLQKSVTVAHEQTALACAIEDATEELVLVLTGSATSDIDDVAPSALRAAGGTVAHFGMPVDPGNLLFLGQCGATPVIGLPGCARSPALNGADWVLARVICGITVTAQDIAGMGVGGLLKEIPSRPQPRRGR